MGNEKASLEESCIVWSSPTGHLVYKVQRTGAFQGFQHLATSNATRK